MTTDEARALKPGLYRLEFVTGESMLALVPNNRLDFICMDEHNRLWKWRAWHSITRAVPLFTFPMENLSDFQALAIAVLKGDEAAIPALLDEAEARFHGRPSVEERIAAASPLRGVIIRDIRVTNWQSPGEQWWNAKKEDADRQTIDAEFTMTLSWNQYHALLDQSRMPAPEPATP